MMEQMVYKGPPQIWRIVFGAFALVALAACFNFDSAYGQFCDAGQCSPDAELELPTSDAGLDAGGLDAGADGGTVACDASICLMHTMTVPGLNVRAITGTSPQDVWAGTSENQAVHFDGSGFSITKLSPSSDAYVFGSHAFAPDDVWMAGSRWGDLYHWDGLGWRNVGHDYSAAVNSLWGPSPDSVWAGVSDYSPGILHWDGGAWGPGYVLPAADAGVGSFGYVQDISGLPTGEAWAVAGYGEIFHYLPDAGWSQEAAFSSLSFRSVRARASDDVWAVGQSSIARRTDAGWQSIPFPDTLDEALYGVWISNTGEVFVVGRNGTLASNGSGSFVQRVSLPGIDLLDVQGFGASDLWVAGGFNESVDHYADGGVLLHYELR
jgi:hypothetical protein